MARKGKEVAFASTPSRSRTTKNPNLGRDEGFLTKRFDSQIYHDRWRTMEQRGIMHERIICFPDREPDFMLECIEVLGWGFMYNAFPPINVSMVWEFCTRKNGELDMDLVYQVIRRPGVYQVIRRPGTNWANNPANNTIPDRKIDNVILNAQATAWHKLIIENIDPKQHGTTFDMNHAILIYVLMTEGVVNLPRIMRDVLLKRPTGNSHNLLPYSIFIARLIIRYQVPEFPRDEIYHVREQDMYCPYRDWKGEQSSIHPLPPPQPAASEIPFPFL
ncbi:hypothetical protein PIB30_070710 [Stylosanthes scabra]|uniref:Uncharacterized protein n=1 Tax=Stylosanthes scabra TaxID=79078 RepID=A0ABU6QN53_9FABA|nr:hypothetical protein [Stylosanthes scabra]